MHSLAQILPKFYRTLVLDESVARMSGPLSPRLLRALVQGGSDELNNLALACHVCNVRKGGRTPEEAGMQLMEVTGG